MKYINKFLNYIRNLGTQHKILRALDEGHIRITKKGKIKPDK